MKCFSKCNIMHPETVLVFHARHVNAQESIFVKKNINRASFLFTSPKHIVQKNAFLCKKMMSIHPKSLISVKKSVKRWDRKCCYEPFRLVKLLTRLRRDLSARDLQHQTQQNWSEPWIICLGAVVFDWGLLREK